jgi:hypothetical protein
MHAAARLALCSAALAGHHLAAADEPSGPRASHADGGGPYISCIDDPHPQNIAVISVSNDIKGKIQLVAMHHGSSSTGTSRGTSVCNTHMNDPFVNGGDFHLQVDEDVEYVMVMQDGKDVHEIWRALDGTKKVWPKTAQIWVGEEDEGDATAEADAVADSSFSLAQVVKQALFGADLKCTDGTCSLTGRHCLRNLAPGLPTGCCSTDAYLLSASPRSESVWHCCPDDRPVAVQTKYPPWTCAASSFRR